MPKRMVSLRVNEDDLAKIKSAAARDLVTLSEFMVSASLEKAVRKPEDSQDGEDDLPSLLEGRHLNGVPRFFIKLCERARLGGEGGYEKVGSEFASQIRTWRPRAFPHASWDDRVDEFFALLLLGRDEDTVHWVRGFYPGCLQLIPNRRREQFMGGILSYAHSEVLEKVGEELENARETYSDEEFEEAFWDWCAEHSYHFDAWSSAESAAEDAYIEERALEEG